MREEQAARNKDAKAIKADFFNSPLSSRDCSDLVLKGPIDSVPRIFNKHQRIRIALGTGDIEQALGKRDLLFVLYSI